MRIYLCEFRQNLRVPAIYYAKAFVWFYGFFQRLLSNQERAGTLCQPASCYTGQRFSAKNMENIHVKNFVQSWHAMRFSTLVIDWFWVFRQ